MDGAVALALTALEGDEPALGVDGLDVGNPAGPELVLPEKVEDRPVTGLGRLPDARAGVRVGLGKLINGPLVGGEPIEDVSGRPPPSRGARGPCACPRGSCLWLSRSMNKGTCVYRRPCRRTDSGRRSVGSRPLGERDPSCLYGSCRVPSRKKGPDASRTSHNICVWTLA